MIPSTNQASQASVHTLCTPDQIVRLAAEVAMETAVRMLSENPVYISEKAARKKYKGLLDLWIDNNLVVYIPSEKGRRLFPADRLAVLYRAYATGTRPPAYKKSKKIKI